MMIDVEGADRCEKAILVLPDYGDGSAEPNAAGSRGNGGVA